MADSRKGTERQKNNETDMSSEGGRHGDEAVKTYASQPESSGFKSQLRHFFACLTQSRVPEAH